MNYPALALSLLLAFPALGTEYFKVDFNGTDAGAKPAAVPFRRGICATAPTRVAEFEEGNIKVVESTANLSDKPLMFNIGDSSASNSELVFDGGNNLVTSGTVQIDFDLEPVSYRQPTGSPVETAMSVRVTGNSGIDLGWISFAATKADSGVMVLFPVGAERVDLGTYELGKCYKFAITLDLTAGEMTVRINDMVKADKVKVNPANAFRLVRFRSGQALGGRDGALTVALDNIHIYSPQP